MLARPITTTRTDTCDRDKLVKHGRVELQHPATGAAEAEGGPEPLALVVVRGRGEAIATSQPTSSATHEAAARRPERPAAAARHNLAPSCVAQRPLKRCHVLRWRADGVSCPTSPIEKHKKTSSS